MFYVLHFYILLPSPVMGFGDFYVLFGGLLLCIFNTLFFFVISLCDEYNFQYLWIWFYNKSRPGDIVGGTEKRTRM